MEVETRTQTSSWRWSLLLSVIVLNPSQCRRCFRELCDTNNIIKQRPISLQVCLPSLILSYGVLLVHTLDLGVPLYLGLATPTTFVVSYGLSQCWCRDAADSWGGPVGYRVMATLGLLLVVASLFTSAFISQIWHPLLYGIFGGLGSSLISAQVDAVIFETYDSHLGIIRGLCFAGQAIGLAIFPHIISILISHYGYYIAYIMLAGVILQTLPAVMFLKVAGNMLRPLSFSRYSDVSKAYALFNNGDTNYYTTELQLHDLGSKSWKSPSDDSLHAEDEQMNQVYDNEGSAVVTPPPSPEEKRRNIFGVEIMPEIPEESEDSDENDEQHSKDISNRKKRLSVAIKRLSTMGDSFSEYITKQVRRDSQSSYNSHSQSGDSREYTEVEVTYENVSPVTDIQREKVFNSFSFRCQSAYASMRRKLRMPSYRVYRFKRRTTYCLYNLNDTFIKPLTRSLSCWRFYPALLLCFSKLSLSVIMLALLPMIASQMNPKISLMESNFLITLFGFTWICFLLCTPWLARTPKRNFKYVVVIGLAISTGACFLLAQAKDHIIFSIGCVVGGVGYGAVTSCWETAVQDFVGVRKWPKLHSTLETLSSSLLALFAIGLSFLTKHTGDLQYSMIVLAITLSIVTFIWTILSAVSIYVNNVQYINFSKICR